jgi:hypothetical protein
MTFTIPEIRMPTPEEQRAASEEWIKPLRPCLYTRWPERLRELSFTTWVELLTAEETAELTTVFEPDSGPWSEGLQRKIRIGTSKFPGGCFFKLESRSPKDSYWGEATNFRACSFHDVQKLLYSERILDDLVRYTNLESEPLRLLFREWHPIQKAGEFRCFIRDRRLVGISQYHYAGFDEASYKTAPLVLAEVYGRKAEWKAILTGFVAEEIIPNLHVDDLVVDLWVDHRRKVTLIEINPYGLSDPCLFLL